MARNLYEVLLEEVKRQITEHRGVLDASQDLAAVKITVQLQAGSSWVRGVKWEEERVCRQNKG